jgi:Protein of unknown function (DUF2752)
MDFLEANTLPCFYKLLLGVDCPGCGFQRAVLALLKGDFKASFYYYPALLPLFLTFGVTALHLTFRFRNGAAYVKYAFLSTTFIITVSFIIKLKRM